MPKINIDTQIKLNEAKIAKLEQQLAKPATKPTAKNRRRKPKAIRAGTRVQHCSVCGESKHNRRSHGASKEHPSMHLKEHCNICGKSGHNSRAHRLTMFEPKRHAALDRVGDAIYDKTLDPSLLKTLRPYKVIIKK